MRTSFLSSLRWVAAAAALMVGGQIANAQTVYTDNFQSYSTLVAPSFSSSYTFVANNVANGMNPAGAFSITTDLAANLGGGQTQHPTLDANPNAHRFFDHTFGNASGLYLAINGNNATNVYGVTNIAVTANTDYVFSVWMNSWTYAGLPTFGRVDVQLAGNNSAIGSIGFADAPAIGSAYSNWGNVANWTQTLLAFNSGNNTSINLSLLNVNTQIDGNDFSIDDISIFAAVPEPGVIALSGLGAVGLGAAVVNKIRASRRRKLLALRKKNEAKAV